MHKLPVLLEKLSHAEQKDKIIKKEGEELIKVSVMTSALASIYEKVRTIVDYNEEHLVRKNAIFRILKRRFLESDDFYKITENIVKELISAKYIANNYITETKVIEAARVIEKYDLLYTGIKEQKGLKASMKLNNWILGLAAVELEEVLAPNSEIKVFVRFMYDEVIERMEIVSKKISEDEKRLQFFIAVNRSLVKSDRQMLEYLIFKLWYPEWKKNPEILIPKIIDEIYNIQQEIDRQINHPMANKLLKVCKPYATKVIILREVINQDFKAAKTLLDQPDLLESKIREMCQKKYAETKRRLKTQIGRAIIYVFLTKMLLALILEVPFDYYVLHHFNWFALGVNILFPPILMILIATTIRTPSEKNTQAMITGIKEILHNQIGEKKYIKEPKKRSWFTWILFNLIYLVTFIVPFLIIIYFLLRLNFSVLSIILFIVFLSIVSFFGLRIRNLARELIVIKKRENIIGELFDFFTLPFIRFGRFLSMNFSRVNIFVFFLDFIIEAPLKIVLQVIEDWLTFFKEKKEDLD